MNESDCVRVLEAANRLQPTSARFNYSPNHAFICDTAGDARTLFRELTRARKRNRQFARVGIRNMSSRSECQYAVMVWRQFMTLAR